MNATISQAVADKAAKLIAESRIEWVKGHVYRVQGDSGTYTVHVSYPEDVSGVCDCPSKRVCSHLIAACAMDLTQIAIPTPTTDPFEGII